MNPDAADSETVFANNRDATFQALDAAVNGRPSPEAVASAAGGIWNPFFLGR